ncbi:Ltp family lipoprotein [Paenibacillus sp. VCA1]|nr:Ltp family lipoprotein [Paenibacillus sp. VCA1]MDR9852849.1 Ltp family lipoprotein [Paenibacillus sp. VCA1]
MWMALGLISFIACIVLLVLGLISRFKKTGNAKRLLLSALACFAITLIAAMADPNTETEIASDKEKSRTKTETVVAKTEDTASNDEAKKQKAEQEANEAAEKKAQEEQKAKEEAEAKAKADAEEKAKAEAEAKQKAEEDNVPREHKSALKKAEQYAEIMSMSKAAIYDQLTSEYGENFPPEAAKYAINNIVWDWKENALKKAEQYAESMNMSNSAIYDQLISEYGEKFTKEEAKYAVDNLK